MPVQEDYGLVMIEAFNSRKPVVTCLDSGEPLHFVTHGVNGLVVEPTPTLWLMRSSSIDRPERAAEMGDNGFRTVSHIRWESIASTLVHSVNGATTSVPATTRTCSLLSSYARLAHRTLGRPRRTSRLNVVVLDMQPIHPAAAAADSGCWVCTTRSVRICQRPTGTYDWPGRAIAIIS